MAEQVTKKQYLLTLLTKLATEFPMAEGLKYLVEQGSLDEKLFDTIFDIFKGAVD